jgi:dTMP kinase
VIIAREQIRFTELFVQELQLPPGMVTRPPTSRYIVLEGISGSGKDTQATILRDNLVQKGLPVSLVSEPGDTYRALRDAWIKHHKREVLDEPIPMRLLMMLDRQETIRNEVYPALERGDIVLSVRSFISTLVYQGLDDWDRAALAYAHRFVPVPDVVLLLDIDVETVWPRIKKRKKKRGLYETPEWLELHRGMYRDVVNELFDGQVRIIDASKSREEVSEQIWTALQQL